MPRQKRQAHNMEALREVNEYIARFGRSFPDGDQQLEFFCECGLTGCRTMVLATLSEYGRVRAEPAAFLVAPEHENPESEEVIEEADNFEVVRVIAGDRVPVA